MVTTLSDDTQIISCGKTLSEPIYLEYPDASVVFFSTSASTRKRKNQDSAAFIQLEAGAYVLAVSDGAGGHKGGRAASKRAIETLVAALQLDSNKERAAIIDGFESANEAVRTMNNGALCTLAVAHMEQGTLRSFHAGDSLVMTVKPDASIVSYTPPHSTVGYGVEAGLLSEEEALEHEERHLLVNALGTDDYRIEIGAPHQLKAGDTLLVASDGVVTSVTPETLASMLCVADLEKASDMLIETCMSEERQSEFDDDLTFFLYRQKV